MKKGRKWVFAVMLAGNIVLICQSVSLAFSAQAAALVDAGSQTLLVGINEDMRLPMASTTKIMTALVALEQKAPTELCRISKHAAEIEGSSVYLRAGACYTLEELLYGLLLRSGNDAATAIAECVAGSEESFVGLMNQKAESMGLENTHFDNPTGLDGETHYTTALELAQITAEALKNPFFRTVFGTEAYSVAQERGHESALWQNKHRLLLSRSDVLGGKTGYTKASGRSLVTAANRGGLTLIAVTLNDPDDWKDHEALLDYGFSEFERVKLSDLIDPIEIPIAGGGRITACVIENTAITLHRGETNQLSFFYRIPRFVYGEETALLHPIGTVSVQLKGAEIASLPMICWKK